MPITKYTGANIKKLKKDELISHVIELYGFIDIFNNEELKDREIAKLKEDYAQMKDWTDRHQEEIHRLKDEKNTLKKEIEELKEKYETQDKELIKLKNDNEIVKMMFIDEFVRDEIEKTIDEGIDQYTFNIGTGYYKEHKLKYVKDIIMPQNGLHDAV